jgi:hypothetical protein
VRARTRTCCSFATGVYLGIQLMPVAQPSPTEQRITIYVLPYIRKFLLARLADPARRLSDETSRQLFDDLQARLSGRKLLGVVNDYDPARDQPQQRVVLVVGRGRSRSRDLSLTVHEHLTGFMSKAYQREMYQWVDFYRSRLGMSTRKALSKFREHYAISEDDHAFLSAERLYYKHCQGKGEQRRRAAAQSIRKPRGAGTVASQRWDSPR